MRLLTLIFLLGTTLFSQIIETKRFEDILPYAKPTTLLILDVDNTLVTLPQNLGSDQWFWDRLQEYKKKYEAKEALDRAVMEFEACHNVTQVALPEESIPQVIEKLQKENYPLIALSTRSIGLGRATLYQLLSLGIDLRKSPFSSQECCFMKGEVVAFKNGVLLTSGTHKGEALFELLERLSFTPQEIVFINDKEANLKEVEVACEKRAIPFVGLRYGCLDEKIKTYKREVAEMQFFHSFPLVSDAVAEQWLTSIKSDQMPRP